MRTSTESTAKALARRKPGRLLGLVGALGASLVLIVLIVPYASIHLLPSTVAGPSVGSHAGRSSHGVLPPSNSPPPGGTGPTANGSGSTGNPSLVITIVAADWTITGAGTGYLGPANQSLCSNCPIVTSVNREFVLTFSLTNRGPYNLSLYVGSAYVGCDPPFYVESLTPGEPVEIPAGHTVTITVTIWPDKATPGSWTFLCHAGT